MVACICHSPLHHQKPDFEGHSVIKASSYLLYFVLEAHRESLPRSCETSARRLSAESAEVYSTADTSARRLSAESAEVYSTADLPASAAHIPFSGYEPRRLHSELRTSRCVFQLHHRQDSKLPLLCCSSSSTAANCNFNIHSPGHKLKIFRSRSTRSTDIDHLYATSRGYEGR